MAQQETCTDCIDPATPSAPAATAAGESEQVQANAWPAAALPENKASSAGQASLPPQLTPPSKESLTPSITIEFCDRCRWAPRATWIQTELFLTFTTPLLQSITLQPLNTPETGGRFRVWVYIGDQVILVWDRKTEGGFPELKVLKQRIRNILQPDLDLGHSDVRPKHSSTPA